MPLFSTLAKPGVHIISEKLNPCMLCASFTVGNKSISDHLMWNGLLLLATQQPCDPK